MDFIFENNKKWVQDTLAIDDETFARLKNTQSPKYLYIGCSDSRVPAQNMMASARRLGCVMPSDLVTPCPWCFHVAMRLAADFRTLVP